jgi:hypothetical protein
MTYSLEWNGETPLPYGRVLLLVCPVDMGVYHFACNADDVERAVNELRPLFAGAMLYQATVLKQEQF